MAAEKVGEQAHRLPLKNSSINEFSQCDFTRFQKFDDEPQSSCLYNVC